MSNTPTPDHELTADDGAHSTGAHFKRKHSPEHTPLDSDGLTESDEARHEAALRESSLRTPK